MSSIAKLRQLLGTVMESKETDELIRYRILPRPDYPDFRYHWFSKEKGIEALLGFPDGEPSKPASILFWKDRGWTRNKAETWLKKHKYKFEPLGKAA